MRAQSIYYYYYYYVFLQLGLTAGEWVAWQGGLPVCLTVSPLPHLI